MSLEEAVGSLNAHEERLGGQPEKTSSQLLLRLEEKAQWRLGAKTARKEHFMRYTIFLICVATL